MKLKIIAFCFILFVLSGCVATESNAPAEATEAYLQALANQNKPELLTLSCKSWEEKASLEVDALLSVGSELKDLSCSITGNEGEFTLVNCNGTLDLTYNEEIRSIDLTRRTYSVLIEDGNWRVCSYK